jgi:2-polyprenyl-6-methoxyphenol hydroxylase-like FAD-dependent oxidoreductase
VRILISGAGIAGPALAYWLWRYGFEPNIGELAPELRTGGYIIDFWGAGFDVAERMGLLPELQRRGYVVERVRVVDQDGRRIAGFSASAFSRATHGRYLSLPRGDLAATIFNSVQGRVETIFGDSVESLQQTDKHVRVTLRRSPAREFDIVIGADGLHSRVREIVLGPERQFEKYLGLQVAAFEAQGYRPRDELTYVMYTEVGRQIARFSMRGDRTMFLFTFRDKAAKGELSRPEALHDAEFARRTIREQFAGCGWEWPRISKELDRATDIYFDRVSQIRMSLAEGLWTHGRVTLLGDAAFCVSLLAGQGSALAMIAAYILAGELHRANGDYAAAFGKYQEAFAPFVLGNQETALRMAGTFAPQSRLELFVRNLVMNLFRNRWIADLAIGGGLKDRISPPEY